MNISCACNGGTQVNIHRTVVPRNTPTITVHDSRSLSLCMRELISRKALDTATLVCKCMVPPCNGPSYSNVIVIIATAQC